MKILVVDDDKIIRMGLSKKINRLFPEYEVVTECPNGLVAFEYLKNNKIDLVITDIKMPIMTGDKLIEIAVNELKEPPLFIVLSGYDEFTYVRDTMKLGALNYLLKPIKQDELKRVIEEVIEKLKEKKQQDKVLTRSIKVLKRDFFKHILFSNTGQNYKIDKTLLEGIQLNENYVYKLIVVDRSNEDKELIKYFIKEIADKYSYIEYIYFNFESNLYIVFYLDAIENPYIKDIENYMEEKTNTFIDNDKNVFIMETVDQVYKLKEQSRKFRELLKTIYDGEKPRKYLLKLLEEIQHEENLDKANPNLTVIKLAKRYIINNFNKNITLKEVADEVFLSQNYLSELFKREVGEGFYEFLTDYRIKVSKELLTKTNLRVYEIANRVGYSDAITFGRAFKKTTGVTPNSFRNSNHS